MFAFLWSVSCNVCPMSYVVLFCPCVFQSYSIAITSLGKERANLSAFRVCSICVFWFCLFPLPLRVWEGLRFVILALPGLFSYLLLSLICLLFLLVSLIGYVLISCD